MHWRRTALLFAAYGVVAGLSFWVWQTQAEAVKAVWLCVVGLGGLFFALERRTGWSMWEKYMPLSLLMAISLWGLVAWERTLSTVPMALAFTASYLFARSDSRKAFWDIWDK